MSNKLFLNLILLRGEPGDKLRAAKQAGFDGVELWHQDVESTSTETIATLLQSTQLGVTDLQVLLDFDGAPDSKRGEKRKLALELLDMAAALGISTLAVPASTDPECVADRVEGDLCWLADEAATRGVRLAYEPMAWSTVICTLPDAWELIQRVGRPNIGLVVDTLHVYSRKRSAADLDGIPADRIYCVQFNDLPEVPALDEVKEIARHKRLLPGDGVFPLADLVSKLKAMGYAGPVGVEMFNDELHEQEPGAVAKRVMAALRKVW